MWQDINVSNVDFRSSLFSTWNQTWCKFYHSHKKRKYRLHNSLDRVLFGAKTDFPIILLPRLAQKTQHVNNECAGKLKQMYCLCD